MNSNQIIRNFNLYLLSDIKLEEPFLSIYNDLESVFSNLNIYTSDDEYCSQYIYYGKSKTDLYIRYNVKNENIWLDYSNIWTVFERKYGLSHEVIQVITQWSVANTLHLKGTTNSTSLINPPKVVANTLHLRGSTNHRNDSFNLQNAENSLHLK